MNQYELIGLLFELKGDLELFSPRIEHQHWVWEKKEKERWMLIDRKSGQIIALVNVLDRDNEDIVESVRCFPYLVAFMIKLFRTIQRFIQCTECRGLCGYNGCVFCDSCCTPLCRNCPIECYECEKDLCKACASEHDCGYVEQCKRCGASKIGMGSDLLCDDCKN